MRGTIQGLGLQAYCWVINLVCCWIVNFTLIYYFAFKLKMGLYGIWLAKLILEVVVASSMQVLVSSTNWDELAKIANQNMKIEQK